MVDIDVGKQSRAMRSCTAVSINQIYWYKGEATCDIQKSTKEEIQGLGSGTATSAEVLFAGTDMKRRALACTFILEFCFPRLSISPSCQDWNNGHSRF